MAREVSYIIPCSSFHPLVVRAPIPLIARLSLSISLGYFGPNRPELCEWARPWKGNDFYRNGVVDEMRLEAIVHEYRKYEKKH